MGRGRQGDGVILREHSLRIRFTYQGVRHQIGLPLTPNRANANRAKNLLAKIRQEIEWDTFRWENYADEFPNYVSVAKPEPPGPVPLFAEYASAWAKTVANTKSTRELYKQTVENFWTHELGDKRLDEIRHDDIATVLAEYREDLSTKTLNNALIPLRRLLDAAVANRLIPSSPAVGIKNLPYQKPTPDPFEGEEVRAILKHMEDHYPEPVWAYYEFAFNTGLRPSEQIAVRWGALDLRQRAIQVSAARVLYQDKDTKTHRGRFVDLSDGAIHALKVIKKHTRLRGMQEPIFCNPVTGDRWSRIRDLNSDYFQPTLAALGIRQRRAYNTRHTYATLALMAGVNVAYIAQQLGHASVVTTLTYYARWVRGGDGGAEAKKLNAALNPSNWSQIGPETKLEDF